MLNSLSINMVATGSFPKSIEMLNSVGYHSLYYKKYFERIIYELNTGENEDKIINKSSKIFLNKKYQYSFHNIRHEEMFIAVPRERTEVKMGLTFYGKLEHNLDLIEMSKKISEKLDLTSVYGLQFKEDSEGKLKALECNPRIQGTTIMSTLGGANLIGMALKILMRKQVKEPEIDWDSEFLRVWSGISIGEKKHSINVNLR